MVCVAIPDDPPGDIANLFALERSRLLELLATTGKSDWHKPSPCPEWTVLGVCCHLLGDDLSALARFRDQHYGTIPPEGLNEVGYIQWIDALQIEWVWATRRLSPELVVELLTWTAPQLIELLAGQDSRSRTAHVSWAGQGPVPLWLHQVRELSEYWIHRQQLLQALGRPSDLRPDLTEPILGGLRWAYPHRLNHVPAQSGDTVSIVISGPVQATWHIVSDARVWDFRPEPGGRSMAGMALNTEQAWRLLTNNLSTTDQANLDLTGDQRIVDVLRRTRAIIGSPN
jgi:uncharacterized protein (TIGR03083 family)